MFQLRCDLLYMIPGHGSNQGEKKKNKNDDRRQTHGDCLLRVVISDGSCEEVEPIEEDRILERVTKTSDMGGRELIE